jgi:hypothetical protein
LRSIAEGEEDKTENEEPTPDPFTVQKDERIPKKIIAHHGIQPEDRFGVK